MYVINSYNRRKHCIYQNYESYDNIVKIQINVPNISIYELYICERFHSGAGLSFKNYF